MNNLTKLILKTAAGALISAGIFFVLLSPALRNISGLAAQYNASRSEVIRLEQQITAFNTAKSDLARAVNKNLIYEATVEDKQLYLPIQRLEAAASAAGVSHELNILAEAVDDKTKNKTEKRVLSQTLLQEIPYVISLETSDYRGLVDFIRYLEHLPEFTELTDLQFAVQVGEGGALVDDKISGTLNGIFLIEKP